MTPSTSMRRQLDIASAVAATVLLVWTASLFLIKGHGSTNKADTLVWSIPSQEQVALQVMHTSIRYSLGSEDWDLLLPSGGHVIHLDDGNDQFSTHTVTLFHQLRCLDILQKEYNEGDFEVRGSSALAQHCLNYFRQIMLCQMDISAEAQSATIRREGLETMCRDWDVIYTEAGRNYEQYRKHISRK